MNEKTAQGGKPKMKSHLFGCGSRWTGGATWDIHADEGGTIKGGPPTVFGGEPGRWTPEDLMLASIDTCQQATFISLCRRKNFEFVSYESDTEGLLEHDGEKIRFTKIVIRPKIGVKNEEDVGTAGEYVHKSHEGCFMSNSVKAEVTIEPEIFVSERK